MFTGYLNSLNRWVLKKYGDLVTNRKVTRHKLVATNDEPKFFYSIF